MMVSRLTFTFTEEAPTMRGAPPRPAALPSRVRSERRTSFPFQIFRVWLLPTPARKTPFFSCTPSAVMSTRWAALPLPAKAAEPVRA